MFLYSARARRLICFVASFLLPLREAAEECIGEWALSKWAQFIRDKWNVCNALCKSFREERSGTAAWDAERFAPVLAEQRTVPQVTLTVGDTCRSLHSGKMKRDNVVIQEHVISGDRLYAEFFFFLAFSGCSCSNLRVSWVIDDTWITSLSTRRTPYFVSIGVLWWPVCYRRAHDVFLSGILISSQLLFRTQTDGKRASSGHWETALSIWTKSVILETASRDSWLMPQGDCSGTFDYKVLKRNHDTYNTTTPLLRII